MIDITEKLNISTIDENASGLARRYGLGIECADFCWAQMIDAELEKNVASAAEKIRGMNNLWFHAPFAEISPCAIDPKVRELTVKRYRQSLDIAASLGIRCLVIHGGYIPYVYYPEHYVSASIDFWKEFLKDCPDDITIALENVMEPEPAMLINIVRGVDDERLGLCLDIGHANCEITTVKPIEWITPMAPYIKHVHLHDNTGGHDLHLPLGCGNIPIEEIVLRVTKLCPCATFTIENMNAEPSIKWLCEKGLLNDR